MHIVWGTLHREAKAQKGMNFKLLYVHTVLPKQPAVEAGKLFK